MSVVYSDANEKYVMNYVFYGKTGNNYLYSDKECTEANKVDKDSFVNAFTKGVIVKYNDVYYTPLIVNNDNTYASVIFATAISASASAATTLYTKEYSD